MSIRIILKTQAISIIILLTASQVHAQDVVAGDSNRVFRLGEITVSAVALKSNASTLNSEQIAARYPGNLVNNFELLPGLSLSAGGSKNEPMVYVRGFSLRQIPAFIDGVPVYVPYDGIFDLSRIQSLGISTVQVEKSYSSLLYGANSLAGAINIVSRKPSRKLELDVQTGSLLSSQGLNKASGGLYLGTRMGKWYANASLNYSKRNFVSLPSSFDTLALEAEWKRDNSFSSDLQYAVRVGFEPKGGHEYSLGYSGIRAGKGVPVYLGSNPNNRVRYWQYPVWNKDIITLHSKSKLGGNAILKTRWYYDTYFNELRSYDDASYTTQDKKSSFTSFYDDYSLGGGAELTFIPFAHHSMKFAANSKLDHHSEFNKDETPRNFSDISSVFGIEDEWLLSGKVSLLASLAYQVRKGLEAQDYLAVNDSTFSFPLANDGKLNYQVGLIYRPHALHSLQMNFSNRSRFATMKDRYSYRFGTSIPNPSLDSETANHIDLIYRGNYKVMNWNINLFYAHLNDVIQRVDEVEPGRFQFQNTGQARHTGLEFEVNAQLLKNLRISCAYSLLDAKNLSQPEIRFVDIPRHSIAGQFEYKVGCHNLAVLEIQHNSERFSSSDGQYSAPAFTLLNIRWQVNISKRLKAHIGVRNLLDKEYYYEEGYPEEGRTFTLMLRYSL